MPQPLKYLLPLLIPALILMLPTHSFGLVGFTVVEQRVLAIFTLAALCWVLEPIPIFATSVLIIMLELLLVSDSGLKGWLPSTPSAEFGVLLSYKDLMSTFASPIIMLFLGGFFLAIAATKYRLDMNLARVMLRPFGHHPNMVILGLMGITATFSMFMSNTATTAMMLSILTPVLALLDPKDPGRVAFALAIPVAANLGGMGTPIGTPPNAVALKYLVGNDSISFGEWMSFGVPFVVVMLGFSWLLLTRLFPCTQQRISLDIQGRFLTTPKALLVYATFILTIGLWLTGDWHGINSYSVGLVPVTIFLVTQVITKEDLKKVSWDVLWLVSGGIALGMGLEKSGLAASLVQAIPFSQWSPITILIGVTALCLLMANFMSHTASANLLLPMVAALGASLDLSSVGGSMGLILSVTFAASLGMALPISTPPNALTHASGHVDTRQMALVGVICGAVGFVLCLGMVALLKGVGFLS
ncbi:SLC13 family permease [Aeromonas cavernicola]|uniref:Dihydroorotate dehydrogenase n=1 Tax=Aeromonas cavernicola TaxID=1006623 RepID=A0A2H9U2X2_9GAMM|nr:SLC13 family permease [Aeromonas cavernicola]PJG58319.1 dihydroorotate dehydrogenase [Aeromonas cavernicola]